MHKSECFFQSEMQVMTSRAQGVGADQQQTKITVFFNLLIMNCSVSQKGGALFRQDLNKLGP